LDILDHSNKSDGHSLGEIDNIDPSLLARQPQILDLLGSFIIISTILVRCLGHVGAADVFQNLFFPTPLTAYLTKPWNIPTAAMDTAPVDLNLDFDSISPAVEPEERFARPVNGPATMFQRRLRHVTAWAAVGRIVGVQDIAEGILESRLKKWDAEEDWMSAINPSHVLDLLDWYVKSEDPFFFIDISTWVSRHQGAVLCAMVEFMIEFGLRLTTPVVHMDSAGLLARVGRLTSDSESDLGGAVAQARAQSPELVILEAIC